MSTIITHGATVIRPVAVEGYETGRESGNIVHPIAGRADPDVTLRPAMLRTGTLHLVFADATESKATEDVHATGGVFTVLSDVGTVDMFYIVAGRIVRGLDNTGKWLVSVDFQEILP